MDRTRTGQTVATGTALAAAEMEMLREVQVRGTWKAQPRGRPSYRAMVAREQIIIMGPAALTVRYPFRAGTLAAPNKMTRVIRAAGPSLETEADAAISSRIHRAAVARLLGLADRTIPAGTVEALTGFLPAVIVRRRQDSLTGRAAETPADFTGFPPAVIVRRRSLIGRAEGSSLPATAAVGTTSLLVGGRTTARHRDVEMIAKAGPRWS